MAEGTVRDLVIFGTGSFGQMAHFYFTRDSERRVVAFTADAAHITASALEGLPLVPFDRIEQEFPPSQCAMFVAVGYRQVNAVRAGIYDQAKARGYQLATYLSSRCSHWGDAVIGDNCFIFEDNTIQPYVTIGNDVIMWSGNHVGHHSTIGDHTFLSSHVVISGHVKVGQRCFFGVNATLRDAISIGDRCVIGAGALIMKSTRPDEVYITPRTVRDRRTSGEIGF
jgi:sugar O-acyltransferase (sialic acid O-acetyltransferase NeuD family)